MIQKISLSFSIQKLTRTSQAMVHFCFASCNLKNGIPRQISDKESTRQCRRLRRCRFQSLGWEDLLEEKMTSIPVFLPGKSHEQRSLVGWGHKRVSKSQRLNIATATYRMPILQVGTAITVTFHLKVRHLNQEIQTI